MKEYTNKELAFQLEVLMKELVILREQHNRLVDESNEKIMRIRNEAIAGLRLEMRSLRKTVHRLTNWKGKVDNFIESTEDDGK